MTQRSELSQPLHIPPGQLASDEIPERDPRARRRLREARAAGRLTGSPRADGALIVISRHRKGSRERGWTAGRDVEA
ncbi:hypothetical protein FRAHR75_350035 [Frankia sp. Hr75.2]|nr:hypothetical protein FRAHR75_350035 [Frankia sp. Hr75.2]